MTAFRLKYDFQRIHNGRDRSSRKWNDTRTVEYGFTVGELTAFLGNSWHAPQRRNLSNALNTVTFVDGHVSYVRIFRDGSIEPRLSEPPASYDYQWLWSR